MPPILSSLMTLIVVTSPIAFANQLECGRIEIKKTLNKDIQTVRAQACTNKDRTLLISENCRNRKCEALSFDPLLISKKDLASQLGKPGFKLCRKLSGEPSLIEFKIKNKWYALDECRFAADNSFVNTGELLETFYKSSRK